MSPSDRARNAALICCHFARNLAYYNASQKVLLLDRDGFWLTVAGNFDSVCTVEWSKLFGNRNGKCHWQKVLKQPDAFKRDFLARHRMDDTNWDNLWKKVKDYRDNFIAHVEDQERTTAPCMTVPYLLVYFYFERLQNEYPELQFVDALPRYMDRYFDSSLSEAEAILRAIGKATTDNVHAKNA